MTEGVHELVLQATRIFKEYARNNKEEILEDEMTESDFFELMDALNKHEMLDKKAIATTTKELQGMMETAKFHMSLTLEEPKTR